jgi:hypothetical protein
MTTGRINQVTILQAGPDETAGQKRRDRDTTLSREGRS